MAVMVKTVEAARTPPANSAEQAKAEKRPSITAFFCLRQEDGCEHVECPKAEHCKKSIL